MISFHSLARNQQQCTWSNYLLNPAALYQGGETIRAISQLTACRLDFLQVFCLLILFFFFFFFKFFKFIIIIIIIITMIIAVVAVIVIFLLLFLLFCISFLLLLFIFLLPFLLLFYNYNFINRMNPALQTCLSPSRARWKLAFYLIYIPLEVSIVSYVSYIWACWKLAFFLISYIYPAGS